MSLNKLLKRATSLACEDIAKEMGMSFDQAVYLKSQAEKREGERVRIRNKEQGARPNTDRGTKGTRKYRRACAIFRMLKGGNITAQEYAAAAAIVRGYRLKTGDVSYRQFRYEESNGGGWSDYERLSDVMAEIRYVAWTDELRRRKIPFNLCRDVIIEGIPLREAEDTHGLKHGTAAERIRDALGLYCRLQLPTNAPQRLDTI